MFEKRINSFYLHQIICKRKPVDKVFGSLEIGLQKGVNGMINLRKVNMLKKMSVDLQRRHQNICRRGNTPSSNNFN